MFAAPDSAAIIALALAEDLGVSPGCFMPGARPSASLLERDATSASVLTAGARFAGVIVARQAAVVAGLPVVAAVFEAMSAAVGLDVPLEVFPTVAEGSRVQAGTVVAEVSGPALPVLAAERTALDFLMLLSGIATETRQWVDIAGGSLAVCDTRKTSPGLRALSKYAVAVGGGTNHRQGLSDMVLVKDNHIRAAGGIRAAVARARAAHPEHRVEGRPAETETARPGHEARRPPDSAGQRPTRLEGRPGRPPRHQGE